MRRALARSDKLIPRAVGMWDWSEVKIIDVLEV
jgi:hypothetical protein